MRHRNPIVLTASAAALLAGAATASAHNAAAVLECTSATITADRFAPGPNPATAVVTVDGVPGSPLAVVLDNATPAILPLALAPGTHDVALQLSWRLPDHTRAPYEAARASVTCPPLPVPVVETVTPGPLPTPVPVPVTEIPVKRPTPGRPPVKKPRYLCPPPLPSKAWQRKILRRHGVLCPLRRPKPPVHVAVAGERVPAAVSLARGVADAIPGATGDRWGAFPPAVEGTATTAHLVVS